MPMIKSTFQQRPSSAAAKTVPTVCGLILLAVGLLFTGIFFTLVQTHYAARSWEKTPCTILESRVDTVSDGYTVSLAFQYEWKGAAHVSRLLKPNGAGAETSVSKADATAAKYPAGARAFCFVNPDQPFEAVLEQGNIFFGLILLFPLIFVAVGIGVLYGTWFYKGKAQKTVSVSRQTTRRNTGKFIQTMIFLGIFLAGLAVGYFLILPGIMASMDSKNWVKTPCTIVESRVQSHSDSDGATYSVDILYTYTYGGRSFRSSRYEFMGGSSSGYEGKAAAVERYPAGAQAVCYVDPSHPEEAVLKRELGAKGFLALIPLVLVLIGLAGLAGALRKKQERPETRSPLSTQGAIPRTAGQVTLKPRTSYAAKIIGSLLVSLFWNGIVSVFVYEAYKGWRSGNPDIFMTLFLVPFVLVGMVFIFGIFYFFLASFNPRPSLTLSQHPVRLGEKLRLGWVTDGDVYKIRAFKLSLIGEESARYRQGKSTTTDRSTFCQQVLVDLNRPEQMRRGEIDFPFPADSMHSFDGGNNAVTWKLSLHCDVPLWPDSHEDFELTVLPAALKGEDK